MAELSRPVDVTERHAVMIREERRMGPVVRPDLALPGVNLPMVRRSIQQRGEKIERVTADLTQWCIMGKSVLSWFFLEFLYHDPAEEDRAWSDGEIASQQLSPGSGSGYPEYEHVTVRRVALGGSYRAGILVEQLTQAARARIDYGEYLFMARGLWLPPRDSAHLDLPVSTGFEPLEDYLENDLWMINCRVADAYRKGCFRAVDRSDIQTIVVNLHLRVQNDLALGRLPGVQMNCNIEIVLEERRLSEEGLPDALAEYRTALARRKHARWYLKWYRAVAREPLKAGIAGGVRASALKGRPNDPMSTTGALELVTAPPEEVCPVCGLSQLFPYCSRTGDRHVRAAEVALAKAAGREGGVMLPSQLKAQPPASVRGTAEERIDTTCAASAAAAVCARVAAAGAAAGLPVVIEGPGVWVVGCYHRRVCA